jgi:hypothetical protein
MSTDNGPGHQSDLEKAMSPVSRFLGHSLAAALGFTALAVISLIPIGVVHLIEIWGEGKLAGSMRFVEITLLTVDIALFLAVFLLGAVTFLAEVYVETETRIIEIFNRRKR